MDEFASIVKLIGNNIVRIRKEKGLTQVELANSIGMEDSALRRIETGRTNPTVKTLYIISKALNIAINDLLMTNVSNEISE